MMADTVEPLDELPALKFSVLPRFEGEDFLTDGCRMKVDVGAVLGDVGALRVSG
jgi:hypothetical protein